MAPLPRSVQPKARRGFDLEAYLESSTGKRRVVNYRRGAVIFSQGDPGDDVRYIQKGAVKLSVLSHIGKEAVVAMLSPGGFFGEGVLAGPARPNRTATAVAGPPGLVFYKAPATRAPPPR